MSDYGSLDEIRDKIRRNILQTEPKDAARNQIWTKFEAIVDVDTLTAERRVLPYVSCCKCCRVLSYDSARGGTSHLRRHADSCTTGSVASFGTSHVTSYFKTIAVPLVAKQQITRKVVEFVSKDLRPFEIVAGDGFIELAQALINAGVKYGQVSANDILPDPVTISRNLVAKYSDVKVNVVVPEIRSLFNVFGGGVTTDMWTDEYKQVSYITVTVHYLNENWDLVVRTLSTSEFDADLRHTGVNIRDTLGKLLESFEVDAAKAIFVTDRGANMLAALKDDNHISCCDHILNVVLTHVFDNKKLVEYPNIQALITGCKELVRYFKKSGEMSLLKKSLKQEVSTRWNSMYTLLQSVKESYDEVEHILETKSQRFRYIGPFHKRLYLYCVVAYYVVPFVSLVCLCSTRVTVGLDV